MQGTNLNPKPANAARIAQIVSYKNPVVVSYGEREKVVPREAHPSLCSMNSVAWQTKASCVEPYRQIEIYEK